jgi:hypothetical protein
MTHYNPSFNCNYYLYLLIFTSKINIYEYIIIIDNNQYNINNNFEDIIYAKKENEIIPAYKRNEYVNQELTQTKSSSFLNRPLENTLRKSVNSNTIISVGNYNSHSTKLNPHTINFIPCINCNNMISIDDIGIY